jgi:hypothetical protein
MKIYRGAKYIAGWFPHHRNAVPSLIRAREGLLDQVLSIEPISADEINRSA